MEVKNKQFIEFCKSLNYEVDMFVNSVKNCNKHVRINRHFINEKEFQELTELLDEIKLEKVNWLDFPVYKVLRGNPGTTFLQKFGFIFVQSLSSILVGLLLQPKENELILDMCAAPGAKTSLLSDLMNNKGCIIALEKYKNRVVSLVSNLTRVGVINTIVLNEDALNFKCNFKFDKILLDPPCTSLGTYNGFKHFSFSRVKKAQEMQKKLLEKAKNLVKDEGIISYSTCTLTIEENEEIVEYGEKELGLKILNEYQLDVPNAIKSKHGIRLLPWIFESEGFFIAHLRKEE
ncbi:MAG: RsmB/NOP family class I SAM-dependent RNA methyltransferase [Candidatus Micrarchaeota archaeon]|nr:RsmB/NOP family class I SAM-dependent RNA methyltransferase [Candidatus Micrarchaeota archaeon]